MSEENYMTGFILCPTENDTFTVAIGKGVNRVFKEVPEDFINSIDEKYMQERALLNLTEQLTEVTHIGMKVADVVYLRRPLDECKALGDKLVEYERTFDNP